MLKHVPATFFKWPFTLKNVPATFFKWRFTFEAVWAWLGPGLPGKSNFGHWSKPSLKLANSSGESEGFLVWCWGGTSEQPPCKFFPGGYTR